ncbi:MAG: ABC transporter ATP-binding protein [Candidatus Hydrogenedentes bacterium]|nr:ABC transporter ATP-binding protein [Candidatus Hydrogenedentota bacterium]
MSDMKQAAGETIAEVTRLSKRFGKVIALDDVSLQVPRGGVFGLVGENGAGKTTLIKHFLGLLKPQTGVVSVFGMDPIRYPEEVLGQIGYLSEDHDLPHWMRIHELLRYTKSFYPKWDDAYAEELRQTFGLELDAKVKNLSRGQRAQAGLLTALAHRPALLLLDEPSSGLDAVVRRDILGAIIRTVAEEGRTVLFSSHLLDEVERVADRVAMISRSRVVLCDSMENIKATHHSITLHFDEPPAQAPILEGALAIEGRGKEWTAVCNGQLDDLKASAARLNASVVAQSTPSLEDIFVARAGRRAV